jgi:hypothetical protein
LLVAATTANERDVETDASMATLGHFDLWEPAAFADLNLVVWAACSA